MIGGVVGGGASSMQGPRDCSRSPLNASAQVRPPPMEVSGLEMFCRGALMLAAACLDTRGIAEAVWGITNEEQFLYGGHQLEHAREGHGRLGSDKLHEPFEPAVN